MKTFYYDFWKDCYSKKFLIDSFKEIGIFLTIFILFVSTILNIFVCIVFLPLLPFYFLDKFIVKTFIK